MLINREIVQVNKKLLMSAFSYINISLGFDLPNYSHKDHKDQRQMNLLKLTK